jgi:hypothetical protein
MFGIYDSIKLDEIYFNQRKREINKFNQEEDLLKQHVNQYDKK